MQNDHNDNNASQNNLLFDIGQIRLAELSVFNWGSFNGLHTAKIDAYGTLITGDNGSGKTTFIDGLMALLHPAGKASFNVAAAQGDRSDRNLLSYMRGSFGSTHDGAGTKVKSKRESAVVTGLRALYQGDDGSQITLAALFWTTQASNALSDVKRVYIVAKRNLTLKEILDAFGEGNARSLKQWLRDDSAITCCDERFADYQELYRKLLYMDNKNAPALLSRALGLKKIDDLTGLIRELVLEPSSVREDAKKVVDEFADLVAIHQQLLDAKTRKEHLSRLPELDIAIKKAQKALEELEAERDGLPIYFGEIGAQLWAEKVATYEEALETLGLQIKQAEEQEYDANDLVERRHGEYLEYGGNEIESLKKDIERDTSTLNQKVTESSQYQSDIRDVSLNDSLIEKVFLENQSAVKIKLENLVEDTKKTQDYFADVSGKQSGLLDSKKGIGTEIQEIKVRPDSNIDIRFQQMRDELVDSLELEKGQCIFIGELIDVNEEQRTWQGSIERALGGLRTTLAVPQGCYSMVIRWLNARHTGLHVRVQVVNDSNIRKGQQAVFKTDGFLKKLVWREHPYREWLKHHLSRFDLHCVASTEELDKTAFSMTQQGLVHLDKGRFEKKDQFKIDDRKRWYLGFSNKSRLAMLNQDFDDLIKQLENADRLVSSARKEWDNISEQKSLLGKIQQYRWDDINTPYWQMKVKQLQYDLKVLEQSSSDLDKAKKRWEEAKASLVKIRKEKEGLRKKEGGLSKTLSDAQEKQQEANKVASVGLIDFVRELLEQRTGQFSSDDLDQINVLLSRHAKAIEQSLESWRGKKYTAEKSAIGIMSSFRSNEKWQVYTIDWLSDISSLEDYLEHLQQLEKEGLPALVEQFIQRLNRHATQSLAQIRTKLESEREDIIERIGIINQVLKRTEFKSGSHLQLGARKDQYPHVKEFERHLLKVLSQITSDDHEARYQQLVKVMEILNKASNPATSNTQESLRLLDPRFQMSFYAEELDSTTLEVRDVLESSSGKSGGEKESFAGTIVAASLAYVLTPEGSDRPVYCTVFLDEAFSNTAEAVSRRVLRVFKELHIHVNLITPYKNLNLARESARSLLIAERDEELHESHLLEVTWSEIDQIMEEQRDQKLQQDASALGIVMEQGSSLGE